MNLKICNYNCCSLKKNIDLIRSLTEQSFDIIFLEETLLLSDSLGDLTHIDEQYENVGIGAIYSEKACTANRGRQEGGLACLWRRDSCFKVTKVLLEDIYIGIEITVGIHVVLLVNVYIKSDIWEARTLDAYLNYLSELENLITNSKFDSIYFLGDFNADPFSGRAWGNLSNFISRNSLECFDFRMLEPSTFTFVSYGNSYCKWLDHVVGRETDDITVSSIRVLYDMIGSDHLPMETIISFSGLDENVSQISNDVDVSGHKWVDWNNLTQKDIDDIEREALLIMGDYLSSKTVCCTELGCNSSGHLQEIHELFELMCNAVRIASESFTKEKHKINKFKVIPGWNRNVKGFYSIARDDYLKWIGSGRLRDSQEFEDMNDSRKIFKMALKDCNVNKLREVSLSIEEKFRNKNMRTFWKEVKSQKTK